MLHTMKRPRLTFGMVLSVLWIAITVAPRPAAALEMQRQDYGLWSYYQFSDDAQPVGSVTRDRWRQWLRYCYVSHDVDGNVIAKAKQTGLHWGRVFLRNAEMTVTDADGALLGRFVGSMWVPYAASFALYNAQNDYVARITVDRHAQFIAVRSPLTWDHVLGYASRVQQATRGKDSWVLSLPSASLPIDGRVWPLIAAFFGDVWPNVAMVHEEG